MESSHNQSNSCLCQRLANENGFRLIPFNFNFRFKFSGSKIRRDVLVYIPVKKLDNQPYNEHSYLGNNLLTAEDPIVLLIPTELFEVIVKIKQQWGPTYNLKCSEITNLLNNDPELIAITHDLLYISEISYREII